MVEILKLVGNSLAAADAYTGAVREVRIDTDNWDLRLHDGTTPGGHRIINQDNADQRYQALNPEIGGIGPFDDEDRGVLTRLSLGDYVLRKFVTDGSIAVTNPDGFAGDISFDLADTVTGDFTFVGDQTITGGLTVSAGINADTSGLHLGDVTGNVTGNLTGNVTGNVAGNVVGGVTGDVIGNVTGDVTGDVIGDVTGSAGKLAATHTFAITGDLTYVSGGFDGSADVTGSATLANSGVTAGTYTAATITVDSKGRVTGASATALSQVPPGAIFFFPTSSPPAGYLVCDGSAVSRTTYPNLAALASGMTYAVPWGPGNGTTTFNLPDLRGEFIRGFDGGRGVDSGRVFGDTQASMVGPHTHPLAIQSANSAYDGTTAETWRGNSSPPITSNIANDSSTTNSGTETRPTNVALLPCIKT